MFTSTSLHSFSSLLAVACIGLTPVHAQGGRTTPPGDTDPESQVEPATSPSVIDDAGIRDAVHREFHHDFAVPGHRIDVQCQGGVITLTGNVSNLLAKERATTVAGTVRGVRAVVNRVLVRPSAPIADDALRKRIVGALLADPATETYELRVTVEKGHVTLNGQVDSFAERELAARVAKGIRGVVKVENLVDVTLETPRSDEEIAEDVRSSLRWNTLVDHGLIEVDVANGQVTLGGTVDSAAELEEARVSAWTRGVRGIDVRGLTVVPDVDDTELRRDKYLNLTDEKIAEAVEAAMARDPRVFSFEIRASAELGVVTLRGTVSSLKAKRAAAADARNTVGVLRVENEIRVRPEDQRSEKDVASDIRLSFANDPYVDRHETTVAFEDGTARLYGTVDSWFEKLRSEDLAARVQGVQSVDNHLHVRSLTPHAQDEYLDAWDIYDHDWYVYAPMQTMSSDEEIRRAIEHELRWSAAVSDFEVHVTVDGGVATLTGSVDSWSERRAARENAFEGGAIRVVNLLEVESTLTSDEQ